MRARISAMRFRYIRRRCRRELVYIYVIAAGTPYTASVYCVCVCVSWKKKKILSRSYDDDYEVNLCRQVDALLCIMAIMDAARLWAVVCWLGFFSERNNSRLRRWHFLEYNVKIAF